MWGEHEMGKSERENREQEYSLNRSPYPEGSNTSDLSQQQFAGLEARVFFKSGRKMRDGRIS